MKKKLVKNEDIGQVINNNKSKKKILKRVLIFILLIIIIISGIIIYRTVKNGGGMEGFLATMMGHDEETRKNLPEIQFLLMGESLHLTDTILVCSYNPSTQQASMLSIPRDTFVGKSKNSATAYDKINSLYQGKYPEKTLKAVNDITGLDLKYYIIIDTKALKKLVDEIGGVQFNVPIDMNYDDTSEENFLRIHLEKGVQKLNGEQAEQLVRFRHNNDGTTYPSEYGEQDIGRMRTQREFIMAVMKQTLKPSNILKIKDFIDIANENVKTNLSISDAKDYIPYAVEFSTENLKTSTLPGTPEKLNDVWVYLNNKSETQEVISQLFFNNPVSEIDDQNTINTKTNNINDNNKSSEIKIQVLNGSSQASNLSKVTEELKNNGYNVVKVGNTTTTSKTSIINRTKQDTTVVNKLKSVIEIGTVTNSKNTENVDFTIIIGKDYK